MIQFGIIQSLSDNEIEQINKLSGQHFSLTDEIEEYFFLPKQISNKYMWIEICPEGLLYLYYGNKDEMDNGIKMMNDYWDSQYT